MKKTFLLAAALITASPAHAWWIISRNYDGALLPDQCIAAPPEFSNPVSLYNTINRDMRNPQIIELGDDEVIVYYPHDRADYGLLGEAEVISENGTNASVQYFRTLVGCKGIAAIAQLKMLEIETGH
jgi:hypothetical protein